MIKEAIHGENEVGTSGISGKAVVIQYAQLLVTQRHLLFCYCGLIQISSLVSLKAGDFWGKNYRLTNLHLQCQIGFQNKVVTTCTTRQSVAVQRDGASRLAKKIPITTLQE